MYRDGWDWDDARLFLAVVRAGSLRAAGRALGLSQPTVGRRLSRFEAAVSAMPLLDRLPEGVRLTAAGKAVQPLAERLEEAALALRRRGQAPPQPASVRISVGEWAGGFLAQCLAEPGVSHGVPPGVTIELVASDQTVNLTRRDADLAVRHGRPETGNLYVARVGTIACAAYGARGAGTQGAGTQGAEAQGAGWIAYAEEQAHYAVSRWIAATVAASGGAIATRASSVSMQAAAARAGSGVAVLPCYLGDADPALARVGDRIASLDAAHWLIVHRDLRRVPVIRGVMDWVSHAFAAHRARLEGAGGGA